MHAQPTPSDATEEATVRLMHRIIERTNEERIKRGLLPLKAHPDLTRAAMDHARDLVTHHYWEHTTPDGQTFEVYAKRLKYTGSLGENMAQDILTPQRILTALMNSPGHRENILLPEYIEIGIGLARGTTAQDSVCVQIFGVREDVYPVVINNEAYDTNSPDVKLAIYGQGVMQKMRFSQDGVKYTDWEPFQKTRPLALEGGPGVRTVYVQLSDGVNTFTTEDTILYAPVTVSTTPPTPKTR